MCNLKVTIILGLVFTKSEAQTGLRCPPDPRKLHITCACKTSTGIIDLSPISDAHGPRFTNILDPEGYFLYSYNPCNPYSASTCVDTHSCVTNKDSSTIGIEIAKAGTEKIYIDTDGTPYVHYTANKSNVQVFLHCTKDEIPTIVSDGRIQDADAIYFKFHLSSCHVCPGDCNAKGKTVNKTSIVGVGGLVIIIILICGFYVYCIVGAIIMKVKYKADTCSDMIPNKKFWKEFPFFVKDGCVFTFRPLWKRLIKNKRSEYSTVE